MLLIALAQKEQRSYSPVNLHEFRDHSSNLYVVIVSNEYVLVLNLFFSTVDTIHYYVLEEESSEREDKSSIRKEIEF